MSSAFTASPILTSLVTACVPSFTPCEMAMCECSSIIPLVKCLPLASITRHSAQAKFLPTAVIFPSFITTSVWVEMPCCSLVQTVAFLNNIFSVLGTVTCPKSVNGNQIKESGKRVIVGSSFDFLFDVRSSLFITHGSLPDLWCAKPEMEVMVKGYLLLSTDTACPLNVMSCFALIDKVITWFSSDA